MKIIDNLLRIKTHREHKAESQLAHASRVLHAATEAVQAAQGKLAQAHLDHDARERALYEDLFSRLVQRCDLDIARAELEIMHAVVKDCEVALKVAEDDRVHATHKREEMRLQYKVAFRAREKYAELYLQAGLERQRMALYREEMELEEVAARHPERESAVVPVHTETTA